jgi:hypothetical protein
MSDSGASSLELLRSRMNASQKAAGKSAVGFSIFISYHTRLVTSVTEVGMPRE